MTSIPESPAGDRPATTSEEEPRQDAEPTSRAARLAEAQAWVLKHHARTFEKLAK